MIGNVHQNEITSVMHMPQFSMFHWEYNGYLQTNHIGNRKLLLDRFENFGLQHGDDYA